jgi:hypothetical protein
MRFMIVETFVDGPVRGCERFHERGTLAPDGLRYANSVVSV